MRFTPLTDDEIATANLIEPGIYDFEVVEAKDEISQKSGKDMIKLKLKIWDKHGHERSLFDYLIESNMGKLKSFCDCTGLLQRYKDGNLIDVNCVGKSGKLVLIIQKDKTGQYKDQNSVKNYIVDSQGAAPSKPVVAHPELNDDIPF